jgi:predicted component of type VI protein secretion system
MLQVEDGRATICDLGSRNGTLVNDERVEGRYALKSGDRLSIGHLRFEVHLTTDLKGQKQPIVKNVKEAAARTREAASAQDVDVDAWLHSEEPAGSSRDASSRDTQQISLSDTSAGIDSASVLDRTAKDTASASTKTSGSKLASMRPPPTTADGGAAAAEILRKLAKYR